MRTLCLVVFFTTIVSTAIGQEKRPQASDDGPIIEVVIVGPGSNFYTIFGHLAVLVRKNSRIPLSEGNLYNFGVTKLNDPGYLWAFMTGQAIFWGNKRPYRKQLRKWGREDRTITRFPLLLDASTRREIQQRFEQMIAKDKRKFRYDTFRQNCSTKVRDVIDEFSHGAISAAWKKRPTAERFRDRARYGYARYPALLVLLEWGAGQAMDTSRTAWQRSGEPAFFGDQLKTLRTAEGTPLFGPGIVDRTRKGPPSVGGSTAWLTWLHCLVALILLVVGLKWNGPATRSKGVIIGLWAFGCAAFGALAFCLHLTSLWPETRANWLMLGVAPFDAVLILPAVTWLRGLSAIPPWVTGYVRARVCILFAGLLVEPLIVGDIGPLGPRLVLLGGWFMINRMIHDAAQYTD